MHFGSYNLSERLGEGGYATVYLARNGTGGPVALKVLKDSYLENQKVRRSFRREARLHRSLDHENIVKCHGLVRDGRGMAIALEYVKGETFHAWSAEADNFTENLKVLLQVGEALCYLHERRIVHLDLKPGNILVDSSGRAKIIDFCLAFKGALWSRLWKRIHRGAIPGSPSYMAPEVIRGEVPDPRADLYSLGVITYWALTGKLPFSGNGVQEILRAQASGIPVAPTRLNPRIPRALEQLIFRLLAKDPSRRLQSAELFCEELIKNVWKGGGIAVRESRGASVSSPGAG